jgi:surface antigen
MPLVGHVDPCRRYCLRTAVLLALAGCVLLVSMPTASASAPHANTPQHHSGYDVTMGVPSQSPLVGEPFEITGSVQPGAVGKRVRLQRLVAGAFQTVASTALDAASSYQFTQVIHVVGGYTYRVVKPADHHQGRGASPAQRIWVTGDAVTSNHVLRSGNGLVATEGSYRLMMRGNGNLEMDVVASGRKLWDSHTGGHPGGWAVLQRNGNLVVHDAQGAVLWTSGSGGHPLGTYTLTLTDDSDLTITDADGTQIWTSATIDDELAPNEGLEPGQNLTSPSRRYEVIMESTGLLVVYDTKLQATIWDSYTAVPDSHVAMQSDGNLMLRGPRGKPLWSSRTPGHPSSYALIQDDGNFVIYDTDGEPLWGSAGINGVLGDDYPTSLRAPPKDSIIDPWRFYNRECVSFVAWRLNHTNHIDFSDFMDGGRFGDANNWDNNARKLGFTVNNVPARGAVAQTDAGQFGHVAWVASVGDGTVTVEEYNYSTPGGYGLRTVPTSTFDYIHFKDLDEARR